MDHLRKKFYFFPCFPRNSLTPFPCGITGILSYDFGLKLENIHSPKTNDQTFPSCLFGFYDCVLTIDHTNQKLYVTSSGLPESKEHLRRSRAKDRLRKIIARITHLSQPRFPSPHSFGKTHKRYSGDLISNFSKQEYFQAVLKAREFIKKGDIYQVNLSQCFTLPTDSYKLRFDPVLCYQILRNLSPSCFGGYFDCGELKIISSSPERFLSLEKGVVQTSPMKGTRPRGKNPFEDSQRKQDLLSCPKERAELLMITDLERNDLGRVCEYGSIRVKTMRALEEYKTVFQTTSTIQGKLQKDKDPFDLLTACFPGGSVTGCPKIRAMQIIDQLEPTPRGLYTGSMGYMSFAGRMDFNILIRTMIMQKGRISFHVGGGIVADSDPENEYQETLIKARAMKESLLQVLHQGIGG